MLLIGMLPNGNIANIIKRGSCDKKKKNYLPEESILFLTLTFKNKKQQ